MTASGPVEKNDALASTKPRGRASECAIARDPAVWMWMVVVLLALLPLRAALA